MHRKTNSSASSVRVPALKKKAQLLREILRIVSASGAVPASSQTRPRPCGLSANADQRGGGSLLEWHLRMMS